MLAASSRVRRLRSSRGTVLITALIFSAIMALGLVGYLAISRTTHALSHRGFWMNAAVNLAETGLEEAIWALNRHSAGESDAWTDWTTAGATSADRQRLFSGFDLGGNNTGAVRVYITNATGTSTAPVIVTRATVTPSTGRVIEKWIEVQLRKRSRFANGLVAKDSILFRGNNASVDSWNSDPDGNPATADIKYSSSVRNDAGTAASISVAVDAVLIQNADIWGYAATGGSQPKVGTNGSVRGEDSPAGVKVDPNRVSTDFSANFDPVSAPTNSATALGSVTSNLTLPRSGDPKDSDGNYYYTTSGMSLSSRVLTISGGDVVLTSTGGSSIKISGNGAIQIASGSSLVIYASGDTDISGNGVANGSVSGSVTNSTAQQPINFQLYGTSTTGQEINLKGNGTFSGIVYAPEGSIFVNGNGDFSGSVIGEDITFVGNAAFHYDESLADFDGGDRYGITRWTELTSAEDRSEAAKVLSF